MSNFFSTTNSKSLKAHVYYQKAGVGSQLNLDPILPRIPRFLYPGGRLVLGVPPGNLKAQVDKINQIHDRYRHFYSPIALADSKLDSEMAKFVRETYPSGGEYDFDSHAYGWRLFGLALKNTGESID